jgi:hypothetical protein
MKIDKIQNEIFSVRKGLEITVNSNGSGTWKYITSGDEKFIVRKRNSRSCYCSITNDTYFGIKFKGFRIPNTTNVKIVR